MEARQKQLINMTAWGDLEVRVELFGNGNYVLRENISEWIKKNADRIALEVTRNLPQA